MKTLGYVVLIIVLVALAVGGYMAFKKGQEHPGAPVEESIAPTEEGAQPEAVPAEEGAPTEGGTE